MKFTLLCLFALLAGLGCSRSSKDSVLQVRLMFPSALAYNSARYRRFLKRASHLTLKIQSKHGDHWEGTFAVSDWRKLGVPALEFPRGHQDTLVIRVALWDLDETGILREYPILVGQASLSGRRFIEGKQREVLLRLRLAVPAAELDRP